MQVCFVPKPNSQTSEVSGRKFSVTRYWLFVSVLFQSRVSIQRGRKLGYALPMKTVFEKTPNLEKHHEKDCPTHVDKDLVLKRTNELKSSIFHKIRNG